MRVHTVEEVEGLPQVNIFNPTMGVDVAVSHDGERLWVNVDGVCVLRIIGIPEDTLNVDDPR